MKTNLINPRRPVARFDNLSVGDTVLVAKTRDGTHGATQRARRMGMKFALHEIKPTLFQVKRIA